MAAATIAPITLRLKCKIGMRVIDHLKPDSSLDELRASAAGLLRLSPEAIKILQGYPPKPVDSSDGKSTLESLSMRSGDTLIVEECELYKQQQQRQRDEQLQQEMAAQCQNSPGILTRRAVPADNSCLFTSVDFVINDGRRINTNAMKTLRRVIADAVRHDPLTYTDAFLGRPNDEYCAWILDESSWGGGIELSILSRHYGVEIAVVDTQSGRIDRFGETDGYAQRVFLVYDGIHYDPLAMETIDGAVVLATRFAINDDVAMSQALEIGAEAKSSRQFTDVSSFKLRCLDCQTLIRGQKEAAEHGRRTGHANFGEV